MASYRFCRSDDVPLLVDAYNRCYRVHDPSLPEWTVDRFKRAIREIDLWTSSCMVASAGPDPIAVLLAAKRERETRIFRVGVHPDHQRQGHGRHLMTSLSAKLHILGPPGIVAEVPTDAVVGRAFLEACGFEARFELTDYVLQTPRPAVAPPEMMIPVTLEELEANGAYVADGPRCWARATESLRQRQDRLRGIAVASPERIEAWLLYEDPEDNGPRRIMAVGCADPERRELWLGLLLEQCAGRAGRPLRIDRVHPDELPAGLLRSRGFEARQATVAYGARPQPG